jgi:hypothetical protein
LTLLHGLLLLQGEAFAVQLVGQSFEGETREIFKSALKEMKTIKAYVFLKTIDLVET